MQPEEMGKNPTATFDTTCGTESLNPIRKTFIKGLGTVRACIDCGVLVSGGPTRCKYCTNTTPNMEPALSKTSKDNHEGSLSRKESGAGVHAPHDISKGVWAKLDYLGKHDFVPIYPYNKTAISAIMVDGKMFRRNEI